MNVTAVTALIARTTQLIPVSNPPLADDMIATEQSELVRGISVG